MSTQVKSTRIRVKLIDHTYENFDVSLLKFRVINDMMEELSDQKDGEIEFLITRELFDRAVKYIIYGIMDIYKIFCNVYFETFIQEYLEIIAFFHKYDFEDYYVFLKKFCKEHYRFDFRHTISLTQFGEKITRTTEEFQTIEEYKYRNITIFFLLVNSIDKKNQILFVKNIHKFENEVEFNKIYPFMNCDLENIILVN